MESNHTSKGLREALEPLLREVESFNERMKEYDRRIEKMAKETYPETALLKQVKGVGDLIASAFVLTIEDPHRGWKGGDRGGLSERGKKMQETTESAEKTIDRDRPSHGRS